MEIANALLFTWFTLAPAPGQEVQASEPNAPVTEPATTPEAADPSPETPDETPAPQPSDVDASPLAETAAEEPAPPEAEPGPAVETQPAPTVETFPDSPADDDEPAPLQASSASSEGAAEAEATGYDREGGFVSLSLGPSSCRTANCAVISVGATGRFELGGRWGRWGFGVSGALGGANFNVARSDDAALIYTDDESGAVRYGHVGGFVRFAPALDGRLDPYFGLGLGFNHFAYVSKVSFDSSNQVDFKFRHADFGANFSVGLPIFVSRHVTVGPRFDQQISLAGNICVSYDDEAPQGEPKCQGWREAFEGLNDVDRRFARRQIPRPWALAFELRAAF
ncbi:MAG: hypothetical protein AAGA54_32875 [Myxococcota bacterium]